MSRFNLGNINIYDQKIPSYPFLVADVIDDGGMEDPVEVADLTTLYNYFRYADHYNDYVRLINAGATLVLLGNRKEFNDYATFTFFNKGHLDGNVKYTTINPEYLEMEDDEIISEVLNQSRCFTKGEDPNKVSIQNLVYSEDKHRTYRCHFRLKDEFITEGNTDLWLASRIWTTTNNKTLRVVIPARESDKMTRDISIGIQWIDNPEDYLQEETRLKLVSKGFDDYNTKSYMVANGLNNDRVHTLILDDDPISDEIFLNSLFYPRFETEDSFWSTYWNWSSVGPENGAVKFDPDFKGFTIDTPFLAYFEDFCDEFCPIFEVVNDEEYTQMLYHTKGLLTQGILLSGKARIPNKEGHDIKVEYKATPEMQTFTASLFDQGETFVIQNPLHELNESQLIEILRFNHNLQDEIDFDGRCKVSNFVETSHDDLSLYNAYESIEEYEIPVTCMIAPRDIQKWMKYRTAKGSLKDLFRRFAKSYPDGGRQNTLLVQLDKEEDLNYIDPLGVDNAFFFSGSYLGHENCYSYLVKILEDKEFSFEQESDLLEGLPGTLRVVYDNYESKFNDAQELVVSLGISQIINLVYYALSPGISKNLINSRLNGSITAVQSLNRLIRRINVENIGQKQNTLEITLVIYYRLYDKEVTVNFNLYKSYGRSSDTP